MSCKEMSDVFGEWNKGELDSFLIEITRDILAFEEDGKPLLEQIMDKAGQKGTGKWTAISALDMGMPVTLIGESVFARCLSAIKDERVEASKRLPGPSAPAFNGDKAAFVEDIRQALYASKIVSYAQGFMLMRQAAKEYGWKLNFPAIALMWRGGCIIRSAFLGNIRDAFKKNPDRYLPQNGGFCTAAGGRRLACRNSSAVHGANRSRFNTSSTARIERCRSNSVVGCQ